LSFKKFNSDTTYCKFY